MQQRLVFYGFAGWAAATIALRAVGQYILRPGNWAGTVILFGLSFPLMAWLIRRLCIRMHVQREQWLAATVAILLPTLLLDPFSSAFFPVVFPNMAPQVAGVFGGWMLWCCGGAVVGAAIGQPKAA
ncbi:MAG TPA: DUF5367 family protein [Bryobacteraceae bacterium]|nr:DUF5367 family protein [Bryobacteraceae bacterium]